MHNGYDNDGYDGSPSPSINSMPTNDTPKVELIAEKVTINDGGDRGLDIMELEQISSSLSVAQRLTPEQQLTINGAANGGDTAGIGNGNSMNDDHGIVAIIDANPPPPSAPEIYRTPAVEVINACKSYQKGTPVLDNFNMRVPRGSIYSLLGSSGCGKTTMLSCCVGIHQLDSGDIKVFGHNPGTKESGVPGRRVGYMPQELSLYNELTIQESLNFYGRIYGMTRDQMRDSTVFLVDFLDLPNANRRIGSLSGGQKRRVSIAIALIHDPELLILDEPTVGVDPLLRESIWNHLVNLVTSGRTTVIITTHYVEEARQSNVVGIMRNGRLLAEKSPEALLAEFNVPLLEDIVLSLCRMDRVEKRKAIESAAEDDNASKKSEFSLNSILRRRKISMTPTRASKASDAEANVLGISYEAPGASRNESENENRNSLNNQAASSGPPLFVESPKTRQLAENTNNGEMTPVAINNQINAAKDNNMLTVNNNAANGTKSKTPSPLMIMNSRKSSIREDIWRNTESTAMGRMTALLIKNFTILMRNVGFLIFIFIVPAVQVVLICLTIGSDPQGLRIGIVDPEICDFETPGWKNISDMCPVSDYAKENNKTLSCFFLALLPEESFILEREFSEQSALVQIQLGRSYGYIKFPQNYTENVVCRYNNFPAEDECVDEDFIWSNSNIVFELDMSNKQIGQTMKRILVDTYARSMQAIKLNCKEEFSERILRTVSELPYTFKSPVYGLDDTSFREFLAPSILLGLLFFFPLCSSGVSYIAEKKSGTLHRALVAGVGTAELMGAFLIAQVCILLGQAGFAFLILTQVFHIQITGSVSLAMGLTILVGISGMSAGFLIAMFCEEEVQAVLLAIGTFFPNILLAGMVWPLEGMERGLQYISYLLPCTLACESMRSIISRGWGFFHPCVWPGFVSTLAWIILYWVAAIIVHKIKTKS